MTTNTPDVTTLRDTAAAWMREQGIAHVDGYVIFFEGKPTAWTAALDRPREWRPRAVAVPVGGGELHVATGGDYDGGAAAWSVGATVEEADREPFKIEVSVSGRWVEVGSDNNRDYVQDRCRAIDNAMGYLPEILQKCGWRGPEVGRVRVRDARDGEIVCIR